MRFLITLGWMVVAVLLALFSYRNWRDVTVDLWGPLQADIKLPILLLTLFLLGFAPLWLVMRGKVWGLRRRLLIAERPALGTPIPGQPTPIVDDGEAPSS